jgi:hypothetical protein
MSMRDETPDPLALSERSESNGIDAVIDEAARRLVAGEPSSSLRSGVLSRIGRQRSPWWSFVPALAGAAIVLIAIAGRALLGPPAGPVRPTGERRTIERAAPAVASQTNVPAATQLAPIEARQLTRRQVAAIPPPAEEESPIPPIAIPPLTTTPLADVQIVVDDSSGVMPIDIAPLQIEPLLGQ